MSGQQTFWSRRRAAVQAEEAAEKAALEAEARGASQAALEEKSDAELLEELQLPDPDTLTLGDDFSVFMSGVVPDRIRRRALRKLWLTNPVLANVDQLVDYGEDFTDGSMIIENLQTAYQVGKGMLKHVEELARQTGDTEDEAPRPEAGEEEETSVAALDGFEDFVEEPGDVDEAAPQEPDEPQMHAALPRRMKFRVEESAA